MRSDIVSRADLLYLFELNELDDLFVKLKLVCSQKNNQFSQDDLIMVQSRFNNYCFNRDNKLQSSDQIQIEFNQIKLTILTLIKSLDIEEGKISERQKKRISLQTIFHRVLNSNWRWSLLSAFISLFLIALGQIRIPSGPIEMHGRVSQLGIKTTREWRIGEGQDLILNHFETDAVKDLSCIAPEAIKSYGASVSFAVDGHARLDQLFIPAQESVSVIPDKEDLIIRLASQAIQGSLLVQNAQIASQELSWNQKIGQNEGGEQVNFITDVSPSFYLTPNEKSTFSLLPVGIDSIGFFRLSFDQDSSTIKSAQINIAGISQTLNLGDRLALSKIKNGEIKLVYQNNEIQFMLSGDVVEVKINQRGKIQSLMPSWFTYILHSQSILFVLGIFVSMFGFLYLLRKKYFSKN